MAQSPACAAMAIASVWVMEAAARLAARRRHQYPGRSTGSKIGVLRLTKRMRKATSSERQTDA